MYNSNDFRTIFSLVLCIEILFNKLKFKKHLPTQYYSKRKL